LNLGLLLNLLDLFGAELSFQSLDSDLPFFHPALSVLLLLVDKLVEGLLLLLLFISQMNQAKTAPFRFLFLKTLLRHILELKEVKDFLLRAPVFFEVMLESRSTRGLLRHTRRRSRESTAPLSEIPISHQIFIRELKIEKVGCHKWSTIGTFKPSPRYLTSLRCEG